MSTKKTHVPIFQNVVFLNLNLSLWRGTRRRMTTERHMAIIFQKFGVLNVIQKFGVLSLACTHSDPQQLKNTQRPFFETLYFFNIVLSLRKDTRWYMTTTTHTVAILQELVFLKGAGGTPEFFGPIFEFLVYFETT